MNRGPKDRIGETRRRRIRPVTIRNTECINHDNLDDSLDALFKTEGPKAVKYEHFFNGKQR